MQTNSPPPRDPLGNGAGAPNLNTPVKRRATTRENALAVAFGVTVCILLFAAIEGAFWVLNRVYGQDPIRLIGPEFEPNITTHTTMWWDDELVYDVDYTLDDNIFRVTPGNAESPRREIYMLGGSFTFGQGVEDDETMAHFLTQLWPGTAAHNLGKPGLGTLHAYENLDFIPEAKSGGPDQIAVYTFIPSHVSRNIGTMRIASSWGAHFPSYRYDKQADALVKEGTFSSAHPIRMGWQKALAHEQVMKFIGADIPFRLSDNDLEFTADALHACRNKFFQRTGSEYFYVVLYPDIISDEFSPSRMIPFLEKRNIPYFNYEDLIDTTLPENKLSHDGHPTAAAYRAVAEALAKDLKGAVATRAKALEPGDNPTPDAEPKSFPSERVQFQQ